MSSNSHIQWTSATWNPVAGCSIKSPGCRECYAMKMAARLEAMGQTAYAGLTHKVNGNVVWTGLVRPLPERLEEPLRWRKPRLVFVNSMSDLFHADVPDEFIDRVFAVMACCPQHTFQILTKRPDRMLAWCAAKRPDPIGTYSFLHPRGGTNILEKPRVVFGVKDWPLPNVWLGVSAERQQEADERIPFLLQTPAAVRFVSAEPLLGPIDLRNWLRWAGCANGGKRCELTDGPPCVGCQPLSWIIVGGESGGGARPMHEKWARSLVRQCREAAVLVFVKQMGSVWARETCIVGKTVAAHGDPKGGEPQWWPESLRVREMPADPARAGG